MVRAPSQAKSQVAPSNSIARQENFSTANLPTTSNFFSGAPIVAEPEASICGGEWNFASRNIAPRPKLPNNCLSATLLRTLKSARPLTRLQLALPAKSPLASLHSSRGIVPM